MMDTVEKEDVNEAMRLTEMSKDSLQADKSSSTRWVDVFISFFVFKKKKKQDLNGGFRSAPESSSRTLAGGAAGFTSFRSGCESSGEQEAVKTALFCFCILWSRATGDQ